jgi:hypothetical protein
MAALRREDGPKNGNAKKGQKSRLMEWNIEDCSFLSVALGKKWMGPVTNLEIYSAVSLLCVPDITKTETNDEIGVFFLLLITIVIVFIIQSA